MGLLDTALGMLGGGQDADPKVKLAEAAFSMLSNSGGQGGGLQGLLGAFQQAGMGEHVASWVGDGQNMPISADQVQQALGGGHLEQLAQAAGISSDSAAGHLAEMLPGIISQFSANSQGGQGGGLASVAGMLGQFLGGNKQS